MRTPLVLALLAAFAPASALAQFLPQRGPSSEQQEFASAVLLGPEGTVLGAFLVGGSTFLVARECCTDEGDDVAIEPIAIGAGIGAAIGTAWAVRSICDHFHPGSGRNLAIGAVIGAGIGTGLVFGGPEEEDGSDSALRLVAGLFLPTLAAYGGWHMESGGMYFGGAGQSPAWAGHVGPVRETRGDLALSVRF
jgi:hypothetical protein